MNQNQENNFETVYIRDEIAKCEDIDELNISWYSYDGYSWVTITVISIAIVLLYQYELLITEDRQSVKIFYKKGVYWGIVIAFYAVIFLSGCVMNPTGERMYRAMLGETISNLLLSFDRKMVGLYGLGFSLFSKIFFLLFRIKQIENILI